MKDGVRKMIREKGEVIGKEGKLAFVKFVRSSACGNCTACGMAKDEKDIIIDVLDTRDVKVGEFVDIEIETKKAMISSAIAYIFPLIMLIIGIVLGYTLAAKGIIKADKEIIGAVFGIGLTFVSYLIIRNLEPVFRKRLKTAYKMAEE